jgi:hypothetical protein
MKWLGLILIMPRNLKISFAMLVGGARNKVTIAGFILIWNALMWVVWKNIMTVFLIPK